MGEANRKRKLQIKKVAITAPDDYFRGVIDMHMLPAAQSLTIGRIRALTGQETESAEFTTDETALVLWAFRAVVGDRTFMSVFV